MIDALRLTVASVQRRRRRRLKLSFQWLSLLWWPSYRHSTAVQSENARYSSGSLSYSAAATATAARDYQWRLAADGALYVCLSVVVVVCSLRM